jgi:hypothetical protein
MHHSLDQNLVSQPHGVGKGKEDLENEDKNSEESRRFMIKAWGYVIMLTLP